MKVKTFLKLASVLVALSHVCLSQTTSVTATITDSDNQTWNNGVYNVTFVPTPNVPGPYTCNGNPITTQQTGSLSSLGVLNVTVCPNTSISPAGSQWSFTIGPNASAPAGTLTLPISGSSIDLSSALSAAVPAPRFPAGQGRYGYLDIEVTPIPVPGGQYYNVTTGCVRVWSGTAWACSNGGSGAVQFNVPTQFSTIQAAVNAAATAGNIPVTIAPYYTGMDSYTNPTNLRIFDFRQNHGIDSGFKRDAKEWGVRANAIQVGCVFTASSKVLSCSNANFNPGDVGKTLIVYGAGPAGTSAVSTYTTYFSYVSGGTAPAGYPSGTWNQYIVALNGGTAGGPCTTPPAGTMQIVNGVPTGAITLYWSGDGCVSAPTSWQISGFTGTSTFSGGSLGNQTLITTIASVTDPTDVVMTNAASSSSLPSPNPVSQVVYGTDDTTAWNAVAQAFANHQGNAHITWTGGSIISGTVTFENWSGELSGSGIGNSELGFAGGLGSYLFWASNTPGGVMIDNAGGSGMCYHDFTFVGNSTAPPIALSLSSAFDTTNAQLGAGNCAYHLNFGMDRNVDPNLLNYTGYWPILVGIKGHAPVGNADFQRLCKAGDCSFYDVKYPVDKDNDQATGWQWGTLRVFYAHYGFCGVGSDQIEEYEGANTQLDAHLGSCLYGGIGNSYYGNTVFHNFSQDAGVEAVDLTSGFGTMVIEAGRYNLAFPTNSGSVINGNSAGGNTSFRSDPVKFSVTASSTYYSGFPQLQVYANEPNQLSYGEFGGFDPTWWNLGNFPVVTATDQWQNSPPLKFQDINPDGFVVDCETYPTGTAYVDIANHPHCFERAGAIKFYGQTHAAVLPPPPVLVSQIPGATAGTTHYQYAAQSRSANWGNNTGSVGSALYIPAPLLTGAATLTSVNANGIFLNYYVTGADGYYVYLLVSGTYKCLSKNGTTCTLFTARTPAHWIAIDDGSYTYLTPPTGTTTDQTGEVNADNGFQVGGNPFAGPKSQTPCQGSRCLSDFSYKPAVQSQFPVFDQASGQYIPGTNVPQTGGIVSSVGGPNQQGGYTTVGSLNTTATPNTTISFVRFTPSLASTVLDGKVYIGATATGTVYGAIYASDGLDSLGNPNAPGTLLCYDTTGTAVTTANAWMTVTSFPISTCPSFNASQNYFWAVNFNAAASIKYDTPGFSGTSYVGFTNAGLAANWPAFMPNSTLENSNIISMYVDLKPTFVFQSLPYGGSCAMSSGTTCTFTIGSSFTSAPLSTCSIDAASTVPATANSCKCSVSGTTATITAGISNSLTWDCILMGNPN